MEFKFKSELWEYPGEGGWYFITLPVKIAKDIKLIYSDMPRKGFGSIRVLTQIGNTSWSTSIFPDKKSQSYLLPVKKEIRIKENLSVGNQVALTIKLEIS